MKFFSGMIFSLFIDEFRLVVHLLFLGENLIMLIFQLLSFYEYVGGSKTCFIFLTKKTPKYYTPDCPRFPNMGVQSQNFVEMVSRFCQQSGSFRILFSIYSFERFFSQLFNDVY
jgi:hypothetical protein